MVEIIINCAVFEIVFLHCVEGYLAMKAVAESGRIKLQDRLP